VIPFPRRSPARPSPALRWAVAAGIVLAIGGLTVPGLLSSRERDRLDQARARLDQIKTEAQPLDRDFQERLSRADRDAKETGQKIQHVARERDQKLAAVDNELRDPKRLHVMLSGPKSPEAGAPNRYRVMSSGQAQLA